jgi:hypothetical protein
MRANSLLDSYTHVLTGYMTAESCLDETADLIKEMKEKNPNRVFRKSLLFFILRYLRLQPILIFDSPLPQCVTL